VTKLQQRIFICIDEWAGVALCCWCWHAHREAFWFVFAFWAFCTYVVAYPAHWGWWRWVRDWEIWK
jgi:hypothetical protein